MSDYYYPKEAREERKINPAAFAFTEDEDLLVFKAMDIYYGTLRKYNAEEGPIIGELRAKIIKACREALSKEIDVSRLIELSNRLDHLKIWTISLREINIPSIQERQSGATAVNVYEVYSNAKAVPKITFTNRDYPEIDGPTDLGALAQKLSIPENVRYMEEGKLLFLLDLDILYPPSKKSPTKSPKKPPSRPALPNMPIYGIMNDNVNNTLRKGRKVWTTDGQLNLFTMPNGLDMIVPPQVFQGDKKSKKRGRPKKAADEIFTKVAFLYVGENTKLSKDISSYDLAVLDAIATALHYWSYDCSGELNISPQEIWRIMNGTQDTRRNPSPKQLQQVCDSMDKMRFTQIYMDVSEEIRELGLAIDDDRVKEGIIDDYLLNASHGKITTEKGRVINTYRVNMPPILYVYNLAKDHILFIDRKLLDTSDTTGNEGYTIEIRNYLLQQIQLMTHGERDSTKILYSTLYEATGIPTPEERISRDNTRKEKAGTKKTDNTYQSNVRKEAKKDREKINALLDSFKKKGHIKGYTIAKKGSTYIGVDIQLPPHK